MSIVIGILVTAAALWLATVVVPGIRIESSVTSFLIVAVIFGLVNAFVRPVARLLSLPIRIVTLGIFSFVINALDADADGLARRGRHVDRRRR